MVGGYVKSTLTKGLGREHQANYETMVDVNGNYKTTFQETITFEIVSDCINKHRVFQTMFSDGTIRCKLKCSSLVTIRYFAQKQSNTNLVFVLLPYKNYNFE